MADSLIKTVSPAPKIRDPLKKHGQQKQDKPKRNKKEEKKNIKHIIDTYA
jgi:hypothetical protein